MTPADLAMKRALDEGARYGSLQPMPAAANPSLPSNPDRNLTAFTLRTKIPPGNAAPSLDTPATPRLTLHQFRQLQHSPALPSSATDLLLDYKRVRRKKSFTQLSQSSLDSASLLQSPTTSSLSLSHTTPSSQNFLPSLSPPLPLTPSVPLRPQQAGGTSAKAPPSLSSTVDTIQSTPTHTPIQQQHGGPDLGLWRKVEGIGLGEEPIRTKRKFPLFKQAKRLPHYTALERGGGGGSSGSVWEVHAVVIDTGVVPPDLSTLDRFRRGVTSGGTTTNAAAAAASKPSGKKGRSVRFEGLEAESSTTRSQARESLHSEEEKDPSLTSSFSVSKFAFPQPPGAVLPGTFAQHSEPTPPTSPATLHYKGASFDLVNPHESLILGSSEIETPAEIDGLLDDYFNNSTHDLRGDGDEEMPPWDVLTGERDTSQLSLPTTNGSSGGGRQRVLYDDPESARRRIMGIQDQSPPPADLSQSPYRDSPLADRSTGRYLPGSEFWPQSHPGMMGYGLDGNDENDDDPSLTQGQRMLTEALRRGAATRPRDEDGFENVDLENVAQAHTMEREQNQGGSPGNVGENVEQSRAIERGSSLYPHSQRSDPFPLTVSDLDNESRFNRIDEVVAREERPSSYYAGNAAYYDREEDFQIYEDVADAAATQTPTSVEAETTIQNIVGHYAYPRPPLAPIEDREMRDAGESSPSIETLRAQDVEGQDVFRESPDESYYRITPGTFEIPGRTSRLQHHPDTAFGRAQRRRRRISGPPNAPAPMPPRVREESEYYSVWTDMPSTDRTYGNTGQLLQLTPENPFEPTPDVRETQTTAHGHVTRRAQLMGNLTFEPDDDEGEGEDDKENNAPQTGTEMGMQPGLVVPPFLHRSSSIYPDDESAWESTQGSETRANLADLDAIGRADEERPSEDSYANTSRCSTDHRLSVPQQAPVAGFVPRRPIVRQTPSSVASRAHIVNPGIAAAGSEAAWLGGSKGKERLLGNFTEVTANADQSARPEKSNTAPFRKAKDFFAEKFGRLALSPPKATYSPKHSFTKAAQLGANRDAHQSASSDTQGLLSNRGAPVMGGGLWYSETANTFMTSPRTPINATKPYSPLNPTPFTRAPVTPRDQNPFFSPTEVTPPASAMLRGRAATNPAGFGAATRFEEDNTPVAENIELQRMRKKKVSRAAMSSQTELHPFTLAESTASATSRPLNNHELVGAEPGWTAEPDFSRMGALAQYPPETIIAVREDGTFERISSLMTPEENRNLGTRQLQSKLTRWYFRFCILCPLTALIFGCGGLDWRMRQMTNGRITEMSPADKKEARQVYVALSLLGWGATGLIIAMCIIAVNGQRHPLD